MAARASIRKQWKTFLKSEKGRGASNEWVASIAILASAAVSVAALSDDKEHTNSGRVDKSAAIEALLSSQRSQHVVQCEGFMQYQRLSQRPGGDASDAAFEPWHSVTSANSRRSLLHRQSKHHNHGDGEKAKDMDMHEKYDIDFNSVLGEGVSSINL